MRCATLGFGMKRLWRKGLLAEQPAVMFNVESARKMRLELVLGGILAIGAGGLLAVVLLKGRGGQPAGLPSSAAATQSTPPGAQSKSTRKSATDEVATKAKLAGATVKIIDRAGGNFGSGVVIESAGSFVYVLTADHLIATSGTVEIVAANFGESMEHAATFRPEVIARAADVDLTLLRVSSETWRPLPLRLCPARLIGREERRRVFIAGCAEKEGIEVLTAEIESRRQVRKSPESPPVWVWQTSVAQARGMSGGPMVDGDGFLLGVASGTNDGKGYYADWESIRQFLRQSGFNNVVDGCPRRVDQRAQASCPSE